MTTLCGHVTRSKIARSHPPEDVIKKDIIDGKDQKERGADKARSNSFLAIVQESVRYPDIGAGSAACAKARLFVSGKKSSLTDSEST